MTMSILLVSRNRCSLWRTESMLILRLANYVVTSIRSFINLFAPLFNLGRPGLTLIPTLLSKEVDLVYNRR